MSPNERVDLRKLEARYTEMLEPIRDLNKNFAVSLDVLEKYIAELEQISIDSVDFANAGLVLQVRMLCHTNIHMYIHMNCLR